MNNNDRNRDNENKGTEGGTNPNRDNMRFEKQKREEDQNRSNDRNKQDDTNKSR